MAKHEVELEILKNGEVKVHIKGVKGKGCMAYAKFLTDVVGKVKSTNLTSEYYEPDEKVRIDLTQKQKN
jgi:hypothetical protein